MSMLLEADAAAQNPVTPIDKKQRERVCALTRDYVGRANAFFNLRFKTPEILFDLKGRAAGMFRVKAGLEQIRYNPYIFAKYFEDNLITTIPHEVAHFVCWKMYLPKRVAPHGREWQQMMAVFDAEASRTCNYDLTGIPTRKQKQYHYQCSCTRYNFTARRHNRVEQGKGMYFCRKCGDIIKHQPRSL